MKIKDILIEIDRIARIENPTECQREVKILDERIKDTSVKIISRGNYAYFYPYKVIYQPDRKVNREKLKKSLGRIPIDIYNNNRKEIKEMTCKELKQLITKITFKEELISELSLMELDTIKENVLKGFVIEKARMLLRRAEITMKEIKEIIARARSKRAIEINNKKV